MFEFADKKMPNELSEIIDPGRAVLLAWNMQNDQAGGSFNNKDALDKLRQDSEATLQDLRLPISIFRGMTP